MRIAFAQTGNAKWPAGVQYLRNLWAALRSLDSDIRPAIILLEHPWSSQSTEPGLSADADEVIRWPQSRWLSLRHYRPLNIIQRRTGVWLGPGPSLARLLRTRNIDCVFASSHFGPRFQIPLLAWIPDFQHLHLPEMFSSTELKRRNRAFGRLARSADRVVLSSQDARKDFERFAPDGAHRARVLSFVSQVPGGIYDSDPGQICQTYDLPQRFFYLPNQFWRHKNHDIVIEALKMVKARGYELTVVCTGSTFDVRDPSYFSELLARIAVAGVRRNLIVLGLVAHDQIYLLMRQAVAVLQPSLFEGWSTTVEEAKSLGKRIILSDLEVHREQDPPGAIFFDPYDPEGLADCLIAVSKDPSIGPDLAMEKDARCMLPKRAEAFGRGFVKLAREVISAS